MPSANNRPFRLLMPVTWPHFITGRFDAPRKYSFAPCKKQKHEGIDFAPSPSFRGLLEVRAAQRGVVDKVGVNTQGYGNYVRLVHHWHDGRWATWYGHLSKILVQENNLVSAGQVIGIAGRTGLSTGVHLHLTLQRIGDGSKNYVVDDVVDPEPFLVSSLSSVNGG